METLAVQHQWIVTQMYASICTRELGPKPTTYTTTQSVLI